MQIDPDILMYAWYEAESESEIVSDDSVRRLADVSETQ